MFRIPVTDLLASYPGDSKSFSFSGEVYDGCMENIVFLSPLSFEIEIIALEDGVHVRFRKLKTRVQYEGKNYDISLEEFNREWKTHLDSQDPDDIRPIENGMIDLGPVIREEIIMSTYYT